MIDLIWGDCLLEMKNIKSGSVDAIICDPPYGTTACKWDSVIPFELMWEQLNRIIKPNGAIVLFGSEPFSSALRMSNIKNYKYDWVWHKKTSANVAVAKYQPLKTHEIVSVFGKKYIPQMVKGKMRMKGGKAKSGEANGSLKPVYYKSDLYFPKSVLDIKTERGFHPTQKPVALMEYLIKTYTNEGETVLDFTMGSGSTGVACKNLNRSFIGIEMDDKYFEIAKERIENIEPSLFSN
tara:strand:- start:470 stop:1180 length:711 start_codon:yes stop_codon:yes gene_type:complete